MAPSARCADRHDSNECQILTSSQYKALGQKHANDAAAVRIHESLEQFRVVPATEAESHIATVNKLAAHIDCLGGARAQ